MSLEEFCAIYPCLYHMAEPNTWESIKRHGLLSTSALLDLFEIRGQERERIESKHRPESVMISHDKHGNAVVRDQKPMSDAGLNRCLEDMSIDEWYRTLNSRVFFWLTRKRVLGLLNARAYRNRSHTVLTMDSREMFRRHRDKIALSPLNSGCTLFKPRPRGSHTFARFSDYPFEERAKHADICVELAVDYSVPDIWEFTSRVELMKQDVVLKVLYNN